MGKIVEHIDALEYVAPNVVSMYGMRVLIQSVWDAAQKIERRNIGRSITHRIERLSDTGYAKAQRRVLESLRDELEQC